MQNWEYCAIGRISWAEEGISSLKPVLSRITADGQEVNGIGGSVAQTIAQLGDEGWEMVGCGNAGPGYHVIYLKRPK